MKKAWDDTLSSSKGLHGLAALSFEELIRLKEDKDREAFNKLMGTILPDVEGYIARRLSASVRNGYIPVEKYSVQEFVNELYLMAFENISEIENEKDLPFWLFQKADELLQKSIVEADFNTRFLDNLEKYTKTEWLRMEEEYSIDGDGELMLLEEFDDPSYKNYEYRISDIIIKQNADQWLEDLNENLDGQEVHDHIDMVLHRLPAPLKSIYDLAMNQRFTLEEISRIKGISVKEVESYLAQTRRSLHSSFKGRYSKESE